MLPKQAQIQVESVSHLEGVIKLIFPNATAIAIHRIAGLDVNKEQLNGGWCFHCTRHDVSIGCIRGDITWENDCNMSFSLPYPAEGASFVNGEGKQVASASLLSLSRLYGYRAQAVSPNKVRKYLLHGYLSTKNRSRPALEHHKFECPMAIDQYGMSTLPLQQLKSEIERIFAVSTGIDDTVKLELLEASSLRAEACVMVQQFEGALYPDTIRRMIQLSTYSHEISEEHAGMSLKLVSINDLDIEPLTLAWNEVSHGWTLPDYDDAKILSHTSLCGSIRISYCGGKFKPASHRDDVARYE